MRLELEGHVVIVTGAARGLGRAYALDLAARGATVVANGQPDSPHDVGRVVDEITRMGGRAMASHHSVGTPEDASRIVEETLDAFGKVDALVNNAGNLRPAYFQDMTDEELQATWNVHVRGAFHVTQPAFEAMRERGYGRIINTASNTVFGCRALAVYSAAKGALIALTTTLALEGRPQGILVNTVLPIAKTTLIPENPIPGLDTDERLVAAMSALDGRTDPETVAPLVTFLASPACTVSGEAYSAMAGRFARVFFGVCEGWIADEPGKVSADDIAARFDEIRDTQSFTVANSIHDEFDAVSSRWQQRQAASS